MPAAAVDLEQALARFVVHLTTERHASPNTVDAYKRDRSTRVATGNLPL